ncbi:glycerol acyltransferase [Bacteroidia bacterium]|nr:glycerol acyltransferase [Bacteroidia bacterium]
MQNGEIARIDVQQLMAELLPGRKFPRITRSIIQKIVHQDDINALFFNAPGKKNLDFINSCMEQLAFTCQVVGRDNLPADGRSLIFAGNHPQGGAEAICIAHVLGNQYDGKIRFYANGFLTVLSPLKDLFLPVRKHREQNREDFRLIREFYGSDNHLVVFPAGVTAYKSKGKIIDHSWRKHFIKVAVEYQRDIVPLYFVARNSALFYFIEDFRRLIHSRFRFEELLYPNEFFKQRGNTFTLYIGKPIPWQTFDNTKTPREWAHWVRNLVFDLPARNQAPY